MSLDSLQDFIAAIDGIGELVRIAHPVRAKLELCEITNRASKLPGGGPALLFEHVILDNGQRSAYPVAINLFGSMTRMALALGVTHLDQHGARITDLLNLKVPDGFIAKLGLLPRLLEVSKFPPRVKGGSPACQGERIPHRKTAFTVRHHRWRRNSLRPSSDFGGSVVEGLGAGGGR